MKLHNGGWVLLAALLLGAAGLAQADTLIGVLPTTPGGTNYQAYYDSTTNLTWLANANMNNGTMSWSAAMSWAAGLNINGVTGWTLPTTADQTCGGYDCTGSQMGELYFTAGITSSSPAPFSNVQDGDYWSATEFGSLTDYAWHFDFGDGYQYNSYTGTGYSYYGWAVHAGNVGAPPTVPEPGTISLMLVGLALVGFSARRRLALRSLE
jgi:hypothetical protein